MIRQLKRGFFLRFLTINKPFPMILCLYGYSLLFCFNPTLE
jgi:hypothetical protein